MFHVLTRPYLGSYSGFEMPCYFCTDDPHVIAFVWVGFLMALVYVGQLVLHIVDGTRSQIKVPMAIRPQTILQVGVLYFVASLVVAIHTGIEFCTDMVARGGEPDVAYLFAHLSWLLKIIMLGFIGLFVGLFDYLCFAGRHKRMRFTFDAGGA